MIHNNINGSSNSPHCPGTRYTTMSAVIHCKTIFKIQTWSKTKQSKYKEKGCVSEYIRISLQCIEDKHLWKERFPTQSYFHFRTTLDLLIIALQEQFMLGWLILHHDLQVSSNVQLLQGIPISTLTVQNILWWILECILSSTLRNVHKTVIYIQKSCPSSKILLSRNFLTNKQHLLCLDWFFSI